jgi:hypothetical protein
MSESTHKPEVSTGACAQVQQALLEAPRPGDPLPAGLQAHLQECAGCQRLRSQLLLLDDVAREQAPELPDGFELALQRRLNESAAKRDGAAAPARRRWIAFAAAAALLLSVGALWLATRQQHGDGEAPPTYHRLRLAVQALDDHAEVLFDVELPDGVSPLPGTGELVGRGRTLQWRSSLHRGLNELDLPLQARQARGQSGRGAPMVQVRLSAGTQRWSAAVPFESHASLAAPPEVRLALVLLPARDDRRLP